MVLAHRPPISIPRTTVAPALLEELLGEIGTLASVYHKPAETFIGKGRIGADSVRKGGEYVLLCFVHIPVQLINFLSSFPISLGEDQFSAQKALQTVVAGQQAENLLYVTSLRFFLRLKYGLFPSDFDDSTNLEGQPQGLAATQVLSQTPAAASLLAGTSSNPLDDLVSIFGGGGGGMLSATPAASFGGAFMGAGAMPISPAPLTPSHTSPPPNAQPQSQQEDLLGLF